METTLITSIAKVTKEIKAETITERRDLAQHRSPLQQCVDWKPVQKGKCIGVVANTGRNESKSPGRKKKGCE